jgi:hypothetical protein
MKHSCLDISNPVRELLKAMDGANANTFKEMKHVIKFVLDIKGYGQRLSQGSQMMTAIGNLKFLGTAVRLATKRPGLA